MKKKFLISFLAALGATALALGFSACKTDSSFGSFPEMPGSETPSPAPPPSPTPQPSPDPKPTPDPYPETDFQYEVQDGFVTITKYLNKTATSVVIPKTIQGSPVTSIGTSAFENCSRLTNIVIPDGVTSIGDYAFGGCSGLTSVTIPDSVTSISDSAFSGCENLQYHEYDNALYLGNDNNPYVALIQAKSQDITNCTISDKCKVVDYSAFSGCTSLTSITIPDSVTSIGKRAINSERDFRKTQQKIPNKIENSLQMIA